MTDASGFVGIRILYALVSGDRRVIALKFKPKFRLKNGLRRTISWFRKEDLL